MASKYQRITANTQISTTPGTLEKIIVNSNSAGSFSVWDGIIHGTNVGTTVIMGTYTPTTATSREVVIEAKFDTALLVVTGGTVDLTVLYNGDPLR